MMSEVQKHYRVTIEVQEVTPAQPARPGPYNNSPVTPATERRVHEVARISIAAGTEDEAYLKTLNMLSTLRPQINEAALEAEIRDQAEKSMKDMA